MKPGSQRLGGLAVTRRGGEPSALDDHFEGAEYLSESHAAKADDTDSATGTDDDQAGSPSAESQHEESRAELRAQIGSSACTAAIKRAEVTVHDVRQQADTAGDAARDEELTRWHADDTAAQVEVEQAMKDTAADLSNPLTRRLN